MTTGEKTCRPMRTKEMTLPRWAPWTYLFDIHSAGKGAFGDNPEANKTLAADSAITILNTLIIASNP
jgi:hypothetical protein